MNNELIIDSNQRGVSIAWLQDSRLLELHQEEANKGFQVGDVFFGRIRKIMPGLNAAFVDIGHDKPAFIHYHDLGPNLRSLIKFTDFVKSNRARSAILRNFTFEEQINKHGKINDVLKNNQVLLIQVVKEPISTKGPRITSEITLAGRYIVLVPFSNVVSISKRIGTNEERTRLKRLVDSIKPQNFGMILRTAAEGKKVAEIDKDLRGLLNKWKTIVEGVKRSKPPKRVLSEGNKTTSLIRDKFNSTFNHIHINDQSITEDIKSYIMDIAPEQAKIVKQYKGKKPIFEYFGVDKQIKSAFGKSVTMPGGAYLVIEHTEAMHVIDVNSGKRASSGSNQEESALLVNKEAATEIARQFRLRDIGGLIVVDFIDMYQAKNRKDLFDHFKKEMKDDPAKHVILPPSRFGLIQVTRQRVRPETNINAVETCPSCRGTGEINPSILLVEEIQKNLEYIFEELNELKVIVTVHPFIEAYLTKGFKSIQKKWCLQFLKWIKVRSDDSYGLLEYRFYNPGGNEIKL